MLDRKPLGRTGRTISSIGLGCVTFGREIDEDTCYQVMDHALENGIDFFDTAEGYGGGQSYAGRKEAEGVEVQKEMTTEMYSSEKIIGRWMKLRGNRDDVTVCTKFSYGGSPEQVVKSLNGSLEHLGVDSVDVYKMHSPDDTVPIAETLDALNEQVNAGLIGAIGCSNFSYEQMREALDVSDSRGYARFQITQPIYNLAVPDADRDLLPLCTREGVAVTPYSPLGAGFLAGKYTPDRSKFPKGTRYDIMPGHADVYFSDRNFRVVEQLRAKSEELGVPMVRLAMAWVMTNPDVSAALIGARSTSHVDNALLSYNEGLGPDLRSEMTAWN